MLRAITLFILLMYAFVSPTAAKTGAGYFDSLRQSYFSRAVENPILALEQWVPIAIQLHHDSAEVDLKKLSTLAKQSNDVRTIAVYEINFAYWVSENNGDYHKGMEYALKAKQKFSDIGADSSLASTINRLALFKLLNEIALNKPPKDNSLYDDYLVQSLEIASRLKDTNLMVQTLLMIGSYEIVSHQNYEKALQSFVEAEHWLEPSASLLNRLTTLGSIAITYADSANETKMLEYVSKYEHCPCSNEFFYGNSNLYRSVSKFYLHAGNYDKALHYARQSYQSALQLGSPEYLSQSEKRLYDIFRKQGSVDSSLFYLERYKQHEDEIARNKYEMAYTAYGVQAKEKQIVEQKYALQRKNVMLALAFGAAALIALISVFVFQVRRKNQQLKLVELEKQKQLLLDTAVRETEEEERSRISGNLHDSVVQKLVVTKMNAQALSNSGSLVDDKQKLILANIMQLLEESTAEIRHLSHTIMPAKLEEDGLGLVLKDLANRLTTIDVKFDVYTEGEFTLIQKNIAIIVYRVVQECLQNILKHARASHVAIDAIAEDGRLQLTIEDDGIGFDRQQQTEGIGLKNIRSRIKQIDGVVEIHSEKDKGTLISLNVPYSIV